jgi:hypothetical protein
VTKAVVERLLRALADADHARARGMEGARELALVGGEAGLEQDDVDRHRLGQYQSRLVRGAPDVRHAPRARRGTLDDILSGIP